jgi:hypothetical protein
LEESFHQQTHLQDIYPINTPSISSPYNQHVTNEMLSTVWFEVVQHFLLDHFKPFHVLHGEAMVGAVHVR